MVRLSVFLMAAIQVMTGYHYQLTAVKSDSRINVPIIFKCVPHSAAAESSPENVFCSTQSLQSFTSGLEV